MLLQGKLQLIYERANAQRPTMELTAWKAKPEGKIPKRDIMVTKNYLNEKGLSQFKRLVTMFIDYAELMEEDEILMSMQDWLNQTDTFLASNRRNSLPDKVNVFHETAWKKAEEEYLQFRV